MQAQKFNTSAITLKTFDGRILSGIKMTMDTSNTVKYKVSTAKFDSIRHKMYCHVVPYIALLVLGTLAGTCSGKDIMGGKLCVNRFCCEITR